MWGKAKLWPLAVLFYQQFYLVTFLRSPVAGAIGQGHVSSAHSTPKVGCALAHPPSLADRRHKEEDPRTMRKSQAKCEAQTSLHVFLLYRCHTPRATASDALNRRERSAAERCAAGTQLSFDRLSASRDRDPSVSREKRAQWRSESSVRVRQSLVS